MWKPAQVSVYLITPLTADSRVGCAIAIASILIILSKQNSTSNFFILLAQIMILLYQRYLLFSCFLSTNTISQSA